MNLRPTSDVELRVIVVVELIIYLNAPPLRVHHQQSRLHRVEVHRHRQREPPLRFKAIHPPPRLIDIRVAQHILVLPLGQLLRVARECRDVVRVRVVHLHPVVHPVAHIDVAVGVNRYIGGMVELRLAVAIFAKAEDELAVRIELLNAIVLVVGDIDAAVRVSGYAPGRVELPIAIAGAARIRWTACRTCPASGCGG